MANFVQYALTDGTEVLFEIAEDEYVSQYTNEGEPVDGGALSSRFQQITRAAHELVTSARRTMSDVDEVRLKFAVSVSGEANWFFAKGKTEGSIEVELSWIKPPTAGP